MQTFMPYDNFTESISCLDYKRLGKQRVEAKQILNALEDKTGKNGWIGHPAVEMWRGYENALRIYYNFCIMLWKLKGFKNNMPFESLLNREIIEPWWMENKEFHDSHKSNLLRKDPKFYEQYEWNVPKNLAYIWPTKNQRIMRRSK